MLVVFWGQAQFKSSRKAGMLFCTVGKNALTTKWIRLFQVPLERENCILIKIQNLWKSPVKKLAKPYKNMHHLHTHQTEAPRSRKSTASQTHFCCKQHQPAIPVLLDLIYSSYFLFLRFKILFFTIPHNLPSPCQNRFHNSQGTKILCSNWLSL